MEVKPTEPTDGLNTKGRQVEISNMTNCVLVGNQEGCLTISCDGENKGNIQKFYLGRGKSKIQIELRS